MHHQTNKQLNKPHTMQLAITNTQAINTAAIKAQYVKADVVKKIVLFATILSCVAIAIFL